MIFPNQVATRVIVRGPNGEIQITVLDGDPRIEFRKDPTSENPNALIEYDRDSDLLFIETDYVRSAYGSLADTQPAWYVRVQGAGRGIMLDDVNDVLKATDGNILQVNPELWNTITNFSNGWTAGTPTPQYYRGPDGRVQLKGRVVPGVTANGTVMFTLPTGGYRPPDTIFVPVAQDQAPYNQPAMEVQSDGDCTIWSWTAGNVVLDAVGFFFFS